MIATVVLMTIVLVGIAATALAEPRSARDLDVWSDDIERRFLRERKIDIGWW